MARNCVPQVSRERYLRFFMSCERLRSFPTSPTEKERESGNEVMISEDLRGMNGYTRSEFSEKMIRVVAIARHVGLEEARLQAKHLLRLVRAVAVKEVLSRAHTLVASATSSRQHTSGCGCPCRRRRSSRTGATTGAQGSSFCRARRTAC